MPRLLILSMLVLTSLVAGAATTITEGGNSTLFEGAGTGDDTIVIQTNDISRHNICHLKSTAGAMDVFVSLDGSSSYSTAALSLIDQGAESNDPVVVTAANRVYAIRGKYRLIRVLQNGGTTVENADLLCGSI